MGRHVTELDGLRGIAILMVVLYHGLLFSAMHGHVPAPFLPLNLGWSGVDLFFVLSGFLITSILLREKGSPGYFARFYMRRTLRIFPLYFAFLALFFFVTGAAKWDLWYWLYAANWRDAFSEPYKPLIHLWSLGVEEQFYLLWPLAIYLTPRKRLLPMVGSVVTVAFASSFAAEHFGASGLLIRRCTVFRMGSIGLGALVAVLRNHSLWPRIVSLSAPIGAASLFAFAVVALLDRSQTLGLLAGALAFACCTAQAVAHSETEAPFAVLLRNPLLRSFGQYSYAIYILHIAILRSTHAVLYEFLAPLRVFWIPAFLLLVLELTWISGYASWHLFEVHFLRLKDRKPRALAHATD